MLMLRIMCWAVGSIVFEYPFDGVNDDVCPEIVSDVYLILHLTDAVYQVKPNILSCHFLYLDGR